jgi:hypothetical protein
LTILPNADVRPPVRRGDLYRDRTLRYSAFVVLDGVFHQHEALSVREIVDVLRDGAWIVGASSMGALRAAECWPAGMQGVGCVYWLFRRGRLGSDDEVAVSFDPDQPHQSSVPLINIRYAVSRAIRRGQIDSTLGERLVAVAVDSYYTDRRWGHLLRSAGVNDKDHRLEALLGAYDLKRKDAVAALRRVARRLSASPALAYEPRRGTTPFRPTEAYRERIHSAVGGESPETVKPALARFVVGSGRHHDLGISWPGDDCIIAPSELSDRIWDELSRLGDLDAEIFRWRAVHGAHDQARRVGVSPRPVHDQMADLEVARGHGCDSWPQLEAQLGRTSELWTWVTMYRDELAWAKCLRERLLRPG